MNLYLFDFDGTLTTKDSMFEFLKFSSSKFWGGILLFLPAFILVKLQLLNADKIKEKFIAYCLKGMTKTELEQKAYAYYNHQNIIRKNADDYIKSLPSGDHKYIVSASMSIWLKPFGEHWNIPIIATELEFDNEVFTGRFLGKNCNQEEKVKRIKVSVDLSKYNKIIAFGDTKNDFPMLELAHEKYYKHFER